MLMIKETNRAIAEGRQEEAELTECTEKKEHIPDSIELYLMPSLICVLSSREMSRL